MTAAHPPFDATPVGDRDTPLYGATPQQAISRFFRRTVVFTGRASRSEFWWMWAFLVVGVLLLGLIGIALGAVTATPADRAEGSTGSGVIFAPLSILLFVLAMLLPLIAVVVRRFHDGGFSGLLALLWLIPYLGGPIVLIFCLMPSRPEGRRFDLSALPVGGSPQVAYGSPYGQPPVYGSPYGQPAAYGSAPGQPADPAAPATAGLESTAAGMAHAISGAVDAAPADPRGAVAALAARHGLAVHRDDAVSERLALPDGDVVVRYDDAGRVVGIGTERR